MAHSGKAISHVVHSNENVPSRKGRKTQATITIPTLQEEKKFGGGCKLVRWGLFFRMGWNGVLARSCLVGVVSLLVGVVFSHGLEWGLGQVLLLLRHCSLPCYSCC